MKTRKKSAKSDMSARTNTQSPTSPGITPAVATRGGSTAAPSATGRCRLVGGPKEVGERVSRLGFATPRHAAAVFVGDELSSVASARFGSESTARYDRIPIVIIQIV